MLLKFGISTSNIRALIATTILFILCIPLTGLSAVLITAKNISEHIQHAAIALLCCAMLTPPLIITYTLRARPGPASPLHKTLLGILTFIWLTCLAIIASTTKYAREGSVRAIGVSVMVISGVQFLFCLCLWWDVYQKAKTAKGQRMNDAELVVGRKENALVQVRSV